MELRDLIVANSRLESSIIRFVERRKESFFAYRRASLMIILIVESVCSF